MLTGAQEPGRGVEQGKASLEREVMLAGSRRINSSHPVKRPPRQQGEHRQTQMHRKVWSVPRRVAASSGSRSMQVADGAGEGRGTWRWAHCPVRKCFFLVPEIPATSDPCPTVMEASALYITSQALFWALPGLSTEVGTSWKGLAPARPTPSPLLTPPPSTHLPCQPRLMLPAKSLHCLPWALGEKTA